MGWCHEFGCQITSGCNHPMRADQTACTCSVCDTVCAGRFSGCPEVWSRSAPAIASAAAPGAGRPERPGSLPSAAPANGMDRESGARVLTWMKAEFEGLRAEVQALAGGLSGLQARAFDPTGGGGNDINAALAELEGSAAQLRTEASRMRRDATGLQEDGAELRSEAAKLRDLDERWGEQLPRVVAEAVQPELRAALREVEVATAGLRDEAAQLRQVRDDIVENLPRLLEAAVAQALAGRFAAAPGDGAGGAAPGVGGAWRPGSRGPVADPSDAASVASSGALADEPVDDAGAAFGPPPAPAPLVAADGGVGEDPLACTVAGVVVGPSLALAVSEALRRAGLRRRRRRRPATPAPGLNRCDPFASEVTRRLDRYGRARADLASIRPGPADGSGPAPTAVAAGFRDAEEVLVDLGPGTVIALEGPASADVARALATSFMARLGLGGGEAVVVGDVLPPVRDLPGLSQPAGLPDAVAALADADAARPETTSRPPTLLVARRPSPGDLGALADLLASPAGAGMAAVLFDLDLGPDLDPGTQVTAGPEPAGEATAGPEPAGEATAEPEPGEPADAAAQAVPADAPADVDRARSARLEWALTLRLEANERVAEASTDDMAARLVGARLYTLGREAASEVLTVLASARTDYEVMAAPARPAEAFEVELPETPSVTVQLLGAYRIEVSGIEIRAGLRAKARELLAFYLLHPAGTTLDAAVQALWPEADPGRGSEWFWTALGNLRSRLRDATGEKKLKVIERDGDRYRVEPLFDVDLWRLERALAQGAAEADDFGRASAYDAVAATYTGDLLGTADWAWAETPRDDLRQRVLDVLAWLGDLRWASGDARGSWQAFQRAVEVDPYAEQIYRRIMRLQAKLGRPDDASATFRRLQARLVEIDLEPTPESTKLHSELSAG